MILAFHKPYGVLSQFTPNGSAHRTLAEFGIPKDVYPIGRLDADSEGLLLLSDEAHWNARLLDSSHHVLKTYHVLIERPPTEESLSKLRTGILLDGKTTLPAQARRLEPAPEWPPRNPPVRLRKSIEDVWIELRLREGRNRQVRRMTAAVGHPTLRLIRTAMGSWPMGDLPVGQWKTLLPDDCEQLTLEFR